MKNFIVLVFLLIATPAWADVQSAKYLESGDIEITMDSGKVMMVPDDMKNRHRRDLQTWVDEGGVVTAYVPSDADLIQRIVLEADHRINSIYSRRAKDQMLARTNELLLNRITNGSLTLPEQTELNDIIAANDWIKSVRAVAASKVTELASMTDQQKIDFDPETDIAWPAP